jgi:hypothetical protein
MASKTWFVIEVEHPTLGIRGEHYAQTYFPTDAAAGEEAAGLKVLSVRTLGTNKGWPDLPNYVGR